MAQGLVKRSLNVKDKVFLVTGGAAGVGAGVVRALLAENVRAVVFLDVAEREGNSLEYEMTNNFGALKAKFIKCDVSQEEQLLAAYKQVLDKYRRLDCVINNAAVLSVNEKTFKRMVDVNFTATVCSTQQAMQIMGADKSGDGGSIVNISSLLALHPSSHLPVYAATKTAILQYSIAMGTAENYEKSKVRVLTVCLGPTDTAILQRGNLDNFQNAEPQVTSRVANRQKVKSAVNGIIDVINKGASGSTWIIKEDKPAYEFTESITKAFDILSTS